MREALNQFSGKTAINKAKRVGKKKGPVQALCLFSYEVNLSAQGVKQKVRKKSIPLDHDSSREGEPDGSHDRCRCKEFLHG